MRRLTQEEFESRAKENNTKVIVKGKYINAKEKVLCECVFCHKDLWISPDNIYKNVGCNDCSSKASGILKINNMRDEFYKRAKERNNKLIVVGPYNGAEEKVHCICVTCGDDVYALPGSILANHGCKKCATEGNRQRSARDPVLFRKQLSLINPDDIMIGEYVNSNTKIDMQCSKCDEIYSKYPYDLLNREKCPKCSLEWVNMMKRMSIGTLQKRLDDILPGTEAIGEYINQNTPIMVRCKEGHQWESTPKNLLAGHGCPICRGGRSSAETLVTNYLLDCDVPFKSPMTFDGLVGVGGKPLSYDFYLPDYNCLIEIQGDQHIRPIQLWGGDEQFAKQQEHDKRKREYAKDKGFDLIEIWSSDLPNLYTIIDSIFDPVTITA